MMFSITPLWGPAGDPCFERVLCPDDRRRLRMVVTPRERLAPRGRRRPAAYSANELSERPTTRP